SPSRSFQVAAACLALQTTAFCPAMALSSLASDSARPLFLLAWPKPMLRVIFFSCGTAMMLSMPNCSRSAGTTSSRYFLRNLGSVFLLILVILQAPGACLFLLLVDLCAGALEVTDALAVLALVVHALGLAGLLVPEHHVGHRDRRLALHAAALRVLL